MHSKECLFHVSFYLYPQDFHVGAGSSKSSASSPDLIPYTSTHARHFFHHHHSGLGHGAMFYLFIRGESKAGLQTQVTMGPLVVDSTPPEVVRALTAMVDGGQLRASWEKGAMVDLEQPRDVPLVITYRVGECVEFRAELHEVKLGTTHLGGDKPWAMIG